MYLYTYMYIYAQAHYIRVYIYAGALLDGEGGAHHERVGEAHSERRDCARAVPMHGHEALRAVRGDTVVWGGGHQRSDVLHDSPGGFAVRSVDRRGAAVHCGRDAVARAGGKNKCDTGGVACLQPVRDDGTEVQRRYIYI